MPHICLSHIIWFINSSDKNVFWQPLKLSVTWWNIDCKCSVCSESILGTILLHVHASLRGQNHCRHMENNDVGCVHHNELH
jgi:hypothetical protein